MSSPSSRRSMAGRAVWFGIWFATTAFGVALTPDRHGHGTHQQLGLPPCPSVVFFDRPCPGCGLTTSWTALLHGRINEAFAAHALGPILYLVFTISALMGAWSFLRGRRLGILERWSERTVWASVATLVVFGTVRFATTTKYATRVEQMYQIGLR